LDIVLNEGGGNLNLADSGIMATPSHQYMHRLKSKTKNNVKKGTQAEKCGPYYQLRFSMVEEQFLDPFRHYGSGFLVPTL
jgi:hypothetical protein